MASDLRARAFKSFRFRAAYSLKLLCISLVEIYFGRLDRFPIADEVAACGCLFTWRFPVNKTDDDEAPLNTPRSRHAQAAAREKSDNR